MSVTPRPAVHRRRRPLRARSARQRGVVIIIAVLATFLIAGMIGYVFNTGRHAQLRQETQNAADATAVSGAGYIARSFNTVAMNNVEVSRLIAVVQMLDSVPLAVEYTLADEEATLDTVEDQLGRGGMDPWVRDTLRQIQADLIQQIAVLWEMDQFFNHSGYDVREMTFYDSEFGRGELWKAMESLDAISQATMENVGELAQYNAQETGLDNMHHRGEESAAFIAPYEPTFLWTRYRFDDYRLPVVAGRLPDWVDHEITNRGPYDTIFGWHAAQREDVEIPNPDRGSERVTDNFGSRWSGGTGRGGGSITISSRVTSYTTFGTWQWLGRVLRDRVDGSFENQGPLFNSQFVTRVNRMGGNKLNVVWPGSAQEWEFLDPQWITDYEEARAIIEAGTPRAAYTQFIRMDYEQVYYDGIPTTSEPVLTDWTILRPRGGRLNVPGLPKTGNHTWKDEAELVGTTPDGVEVRTVLIREFVWAGMNVGPRIELRNPNNFSSRADLPAPIDFMHELMFRPQDGAIGRPGEPFAILGVAKQPSTAPMWSRLFRATAYDGHVAIAQAGIFNNHSWDLWTQMWHAQLEPVQDFSGWVTVMQTNPGALSGYPDLSPAEVEEIVEYLRSVEDLAPILLNH